VRIGILSEKYEGGGVGTISTGAGDSGGVSYGQFQLATNTGSVAAFVEYLLSRDDYGRDYGNVLARFEPGTMEFSAEWLALAETDPEGFAALNEDYVMPRYFDAALTVAQEHGLPVDLPDALKAVLFSNAIQHGPQNAGELVADCYDPDPAEWIRKIYNAKIIDPDWSSGAPELRPGLFERWENEKQDAIGLLDGEGLKCVDEI